MIRNYRSGFKSYFKKKKQSKNIPNFKQRQNLPKLIESNGKKIPALSTKTASKINHFYKFRPPTYKEGLRYPPGAINGDPAWKPLSRVQFQLSAIWEVHRSNGNMAMVRRCQTARCMCTLHWCTCVCWSRVVCGWVVGWLVSCFE